jgi:hypothetical protein
MKSNTYGDLKKLIREEIKSLIKEEEGASADTGSTLARDIRNTGINLMKNPSGINSVEAAGLKNLLVRLISLSKEKNLSTITLDRINKILDTISK